MLACRAVRPWIVIAAVVLAAVLVALLLRGREEDAVTQVRRTLRHAVDAVENQDLGALMDKVSERFRGRGGMNRDGVKGVLFVQLRRGDWRRVFLVDTTIEVDDDQRGARVRTGAVLASGDDLRSVVDVAPTNAATYEFDLRLELEDDDEWRVVSATYQRADLGGLLQRLEP